MILLYELQFGLFKYFCPFRVLAEFNDFTLHQDQITYSPLAGARGDVILSWELEEVSFNREQISSISSMGSI